LSRVNLEDISPLEGKNTENWEGEMNIFNVYVKFIHVSINIININVDRVKFYATIQTN